MDSLLNIIIDPGKVFTHIKEKDDWWIPFILIVIIAFIVSWISSPVIARLTAQRLAEMGIDREMPGGLGLIRYIMIPVGTLISWFIISVIFWMISNSFGGDWNFIKALDLYAYSSVVGVIKSILTIIVLKIRGLQNIASFRDLSIDSGLTLFFKPESTRMYTLVSGIDIFQIWIYVLLAFGISELAGISRKKAAIVSIITFIITLAFKVLLTREGSY